jgi:hypothetical protein
MIKYLSLIKNTLIQTFYFTKIEIVKILFISHIINEINMRYRQPIDQLYSFKQLVVLTIYLSGEPLNLIW